jgi:DNA-binding response OmpR family regulator
MRSLRVLIVEDAADLANAMADVLFDHGHDVAVHEGKSLEDVLACVINEPCDALVLDLGLMFDGTVVVDALSLSRERPAIVVCTGAPERRVAPLRGRVEAVLRKPFTMADLVMSLEGAVIRRRREHAALEALEPIKRRHSA